jgi:hypothetical protein
MENEGLGEGRRGVGEGESIMESGAGYKESRSKAQMDHKMGWKEEDV